MQTEYGYDPFGLAASVGLLSENQFQFRGGENDGTGLQYSGGDYYDPNQQRFINEGSGSDNSYASDGNNPLSGGGQSGPVNYLRNYSVDSFSNFGVNVVSELAMLDEIAKESWDLGNHCLPLWDRVWAGAKLAGRIAFVALGGVIARGLIRGIRAGVGLLRGARVAAKPANLALDSASSWGRSKTLADHFGRHGGDFGAKSADDYAAMASEFLQRSQRTGLPTKIDNKGVIRIYDPATNTFGSFNPNGTTRTLYRPNPAVHGFPTNMHYWNAQPGVLR